MLIGNLLDLSPPYSRGDHSVSPSHGCRLEDVRDLGVDGLVVTSPGGIGAVSQRVVVWEHLAVREFARQEKRKPLVVDNVLVGGDGELASTVEQPLVFFIQWVNFSCSCSQSPCPHLMDTVPQDSHGEKERILITTGIADSYRKAMSTNFGGEEREEGEKGGLWSTYSRNG